ncbi:MAG: glycosyltransferase family 2 protein [Nitrospinales bacterium]
MKTHLYTLCWNEADMLEFFFRNYDPWIDRYIVFDDGSTDGSQDTLKSHPKVELRKWHRKYPDSYLMSQLDWLNTVWKESRNSADWVVIVDIDEHLFSQQTPMKEFLEKYKSQGITLVPSLGFQVVSEDFPKSHEYLVKTRTWGKPWEWMCKLSIFNPDAIIETNFTSGRHTAKAVGKVKLPRRDTLLLFHYKYLGFEHTLEKQNSQHSNIGAHDVAVMEHYAWNREQLRNHWDNILKDSVELSWPEYDPKTFPYFCRWWLFGGILYSFTQWYRRAIKFLQSPGYMLDRLKAFRIQDKIGQFIEEINRSPFRKKVYSSVMHGQTNENSNNIFIASNENDKKGILIQCLHSVDINKPQSNVDVQNLISIKNEKKKTYQKDFDAFFITNSKSFENTTIMLSKKNNIQMVCRKDLIEFISQLNIS